MAGIVGTSVGLDNVGLVINPSVESTNINDYATVINGVTSRQVVTVLGEYNKILKADGGCGVGATAMDIPTNSYTWLPVEMKAWGTYCLKNLRTNLIAKGVALGYEAADISKAIVMVQQGIASAAQSTMVEIIIFDLHTRAVAGDIVRKSWFGDTAMALISGGGNLKNTESVANYNELDGIYKQLVAVVTADASRKYAIAENGNSTYATQDTLADGRAKTIFSSLYEGMSDKLASYTDPVLIISKSLKNNWLRTIDNNVTLESAKNELYNGGVQFDFRSMPMIVVPEWDRWVKSDFNNGTKYTMPRHMAVLTSKSNLQIGFDTDDVDQQTKWWFDEKEELFNIKSNFAWDIKFADGELVQVAY